MVSYSVVGQFTPKMMCHRVSYGENIYPKTEVSYGVIQCQRFSLSYAENKECHAESYPFDQENGVS